MAKVWWIYGRKRRLMFAGLAVAMPCALAAFVIIWRPAIAPITPPSRASFPQALVERGAVLATIGDCAVCHTTPGGRPLAGARALPTPFGTIYSSNITPDIVTGIGSWSFAAFERAMREGVRRDGVHLYPALPYDHYTHVTDGDLKAIYAFLMSRRPVHADAPANRLDFPFGFRPLLAGWKLLYLRKGPIASDPRQSAEWNRGAYLAEGLAHCAACHTPRGLMGAEERDRPYAGGLAEGWRAPALDASNPAAARWTAEALYQFLRTGISPQHSAAAGPMGPVADGLSTAPEKDVRAIAVYIASRMGGGVPPGRRALDQTASAARSDPAGASIFAGACAGCHDSGASMLSQGRPALGLATDLRDGDPRSAIQAVLQGIEPPVAGRGPKMPPFADILTDAQVAHALAYARARYTDQPAWPQLEKAVRKVRKDAQP